jgi:DNA-binding response OmpR family regulator
MAQRILVVDDEPYLVLTLELLLGQAGFQVDTVNDGEAALAALRREPADLVLLDVMLPGQDGFSVCQQIRTQTAWRQVKIVMITARGREVEREKALALGADAFIVKPFAIQELVETIHRLLPATV